MNESLKGRQRTIEKQYIPKHVQISVLFCVIDVIINMLMLTEASIHIP